MTHIPDDLTPFVTQNPCNDPLCRAAPGTIGYIKRVGNQDVVYCIGADGNRSLHHARRNAPRSETGNPTESLRTRPGVAPSKRARILARENCACAVCHRADVPLDVGHIISRNAGLTAGLTDYELESDDNLMAACASCNSGQGREPATLRFLLALLHARLIHQHPQTPDEYGTLFAP